MYNKLCVHRILGCKDDVPQKYSGMMKNGTFDLYTMVFVINTVTYCYEIKRIIELNI